MNWAAILRACALTMAFLPLYSASSRGLKCSWTSISADCLSVPSGGGGGGGSRRNTEFNIYMFRSINCANSPDIYVSFVMNFATDHWTSASKPRGTFCLNGASAIGERCVTSTVLAGGDNVWVADALENTPYKIGYIGQPNANSYTLVDGNACAPMTPGCIGWMSYQGGPGGNGVNPRMDVACQGGA